MRARPRGMHRRAPLFLSTHPPRPPHPLSTLSPSALPHVEPAAGARPRGPIRPLDSRAARQAAARAGVPPAPRFSSGGGSGGRAPPRYSDDDDIRAQERVLLDVWSDARFAAAGGALAGALLLAFLAKADF